MAGFRSKRIALPEAVKRMDKALKRDTGTPPKPYQPARKKKDALQIPAAKLVSPKRRSKRAPA